MHPAARGFLHTVFMFCLSECFVLTTIAHSYMTLASKPYLKQISANYSIVRRRRMGLVMLLTANISSH